ncbi:unnamed protein product [Cochlearia groenlandica]
MDSKSWINCSSVFSSSSSSSSSRRFQSRSDLYSGGGAGGGYDDLEVEDDSKAEFICPFCAEDFDIVGLCCHIDEEHPLEAKNGVCPVCTKRVGLDIVGHITTQHSNFFKISFKDLKLRRGAYNAAYVALKKELREANLQSLLGGTSSFTSSTNIDYDPLLSSFMFNSPSRNESANRSVVTPLIEGNSDTKVSYKDSLKRDIQEAPLSREDQEKGKKSEFVRGLLLSTMLGDGV